MVVMHPRGHLSYATEVAARFPGSRTHISVRRSEDGEFRQVESYADTLAIPGVNDTA